MPKKFTPLQCTPLEWLLEPENPSSRYQTLTRLLGRPETDPEVQEAYQNLYTSGPVEQILSNQDATGWWDNPDHILSPFYSSTGWQIHTLAELGAHLPQGQIELGCELIFNKGQSELGDFPPVGHNYVKKVPSDMLCVDGQLIWALLKVGQPLTDERMRLAVDFLSDALLKSEGACRFNQDRPCAWGMVKALRALAQVTTPERNPRTQTAISQAANFLLDGDLAHARYPTKEAGSVSRHWFNFGFPRSWTTDILQVLVILTTLGFGRDSRIDEAVAYMFSKRLSDGTWKCDETIASLPVRLERQGQPSKRITLDAMVVEKFHQFTRSTPTNIGEGASNCGLPYPLDISSL